MVSAEDADGEDNKGHHDIIPHDHLSSDYDVDTSAVGEFEGEASLALLSYDSINLTCEEELDENFGGDGDVPFPSPFPPTCVLTTKLLSRWPNRVV